MLIPFCYLCGRRIEWDRLNEKSVDIEVFCPYCGVRVANTLCLKCARELYYKLKHALEARNVKLD